VQVVLKYDRAMFLSLGKIFRPFLELNSFFLGLNIFP